MSSTFSTLTRWAGRAVLMALATMVGASSASAETLMMPKRDARMGTSVVVWGVHTQAAGTACTLNFGDATPDFDCTGVDRSYIAAAHTYATQGTFTATLTVGIEVATVSITVFNPAGLPGGAAGDANRGLGINMAIQDGLRYLWTSQASRAANFPAGVTTNWGNSFPVSLVSMVVLAFENHGYKVPNNASAPTGLYEKYIVRRGLNYVMSQLSALALSTQPAGTPCVAGLGVAAGDCGGLQPSGGDLGYQTAVVMLPFAASGALSRVNTEVAGATFNKTFGEILQRLVNSEAYGQTDSGVGRGGFGYHHNGGQFDGSTIGWTVLGFLDAEAAGATVPAFVRSEFAIGFANALNNDGSFDYIEDGNPAVKTYVNPQKAGIGLQGLYFLGTPGPFAGGSKGANALTYVSDHWPGAYLAGDYTGWNCSPSASFNKGCGYTMFNNFKGLKLNGITTLPGVTRAAGPGAQPAGDWYADYQDWLVSNQTVPSTTSGGSWNGMGFSCCYSNVVIGTAVAELILSPVALVLPDEDKFAAVGLTPSTNTALYRTFHTATAKAESTGGTPVPGATVNFTILTGPNAGLTGTGTTNSSGVAPFTYQGVGGVGTDTIQATIGTLSSNIVNMNWTPVSLSATITAANKVYDGSTSGTVTGCTLSGVLGGDAVTCDFGAAVGTFADPNVGSWSVTGAPLNLAGAMAGNYVINSTLSATASITPATPVATAAGGTHVYDGASHGGTCAVTGVNNEVLAGTTTYSSGGAPTNVGAYTITCAIAAGGNYTAASDDDDITITPATPVATATGGTHVYDGQAHGGTCAVTGVNETLAGTTTYSSGGAPTNVGAYTVTCAIAADGNYTAASDDDDITITPATPVATATGGTHVYDGQAHGGTCAVTGVNETLAGTTTYSSGGAPTNVGAYTVTCAIAADGNYTAASDDDDITITPATPVATATGGTHVYDGQPHGGTCAVTGVNETLVGTTTYSSGGAPTNVGTYTVTCAIAAGGNYSAASDDDDITITPATPVATATGGTHVYDGQPHGGTCAVTGVNETLAGTTTYSSGGAPTNVGTYTVTCAIAADGNYTAASDTDDITITPATPVATATGGTHVYDGQPHGGTCAVTGVNETLAGTTTYSSGGAPTNVGAYTVTCAIAADGNYTAASDTDDITITPATPVATATGGTHVYDGQPHGGTCAVTGVNETLAGTTTYSSGGAPTNVGAYTVTCAIAADGNYTAASDTDDITINPADSTIVVTCAPSVTYTSLAIEACVATVTGAGGLSENVDVTYTANTSVGAAGASATYGGDANHTESTGTGGFAITPAGLTVSAFSYSRSYLAADPAFSGTLVGVLGADGITAIFGSTGAGSQVPGVYATVPTLVDPNVKLGNYAVSSHNGTLTITNMAPVCTAATASPASIWPPNHQWVPIIISGYTDVDGGPLGLTIVSIFQDEPTNTHGDGHTAIDGKGVGTNTAWVRAERMGKSWKSGHSGKGSHKSGKSGKGHGSDKSGKSGKSSKGGGNGRVYTITFTVTDSLGLTCTGTVLVGVPHDQSGPAAVNDGALYDSTVPTPRPKSDKSDKSGKSGKSGKGDDCKSGKSHKHSGGKSGDKSSKPAPKVVPAPPKPAPKAPPAPAPKPVAPKGKK